MLLKQPHLEARSIVESMLVTLAHRGPDDRGMYVSSDQRIVLGHNRLSIIDLSPAGHQPMVSETTGNVLVFNGEIYNFHDLRDELAARGVAFRSKSDTEVLLRALDHWGIACLAKLRGMFSFAYWNAREKVVHLARDPLGMKPLYYMEDYRGSFAFASELKAFLASPKGARCMDMASLREFLEFGYVFDQHRTSIEGVRKLPPGALLTYDLERGVSTVRCYYNAPSVKPNDDEFESNRECVETELYEALSLVVRQHLVADVPVGLLLSGGLDSSLLAAIAAKHTPVRTLTMGFAASILDERREARFVADAIKSDHEEVLITPDDIRDDLPSQIAVIDDLFADWGTVSTRILYRKCRERGVKVVIVGEGADELFGGYDVFRQAISRKPEEVWLFSLYRLYAGRRFGHLFSRFRAVMKEHLAKSHGDRFQAIRYFETGNQMPNNYVMKVDKASMAESVEARAPYLDQRIADIAFRIGGRQLISASTEKVLLRGVAERFTLLPRETFARRKLGGGIAGTWMDDDTKWRRFSREVILKEGIWTRSLGLTGAMNAYLTHGRQGYPAPHPISIFRNLAWRLLLLELWSKAYGVEPANS